MAASRLPVRRYLLTPLVVSVVFMVVAGYQERHNLLPSLGLVPPATPPAGDPEPAKTAVRAFADDLQRVYATGDASALPPGRVADGLRAAVAAELALPASAAEARGLALEQWEVLQATPQADGWRVVTDETWAAPGGRPHRLRHQYRLDAALRVLETTPMLPEPVRDADR